MCIRDSYVDSACDGRRFRIIASYLSNVANFNRRHLHLAPQSGVTPFEFCRDLRRQKTRVPGESCNVVWVISRLAVSVEHRLVTDSLRQTHDYGVYGSSMASRVKKNKSQPSQTVRATLCVTAVVITVNKISNSTTWSYPEASYTNCSKFLEMDAVHMLFAADLNSLASRRKDISRKFFHDITKSTSCLHHFLSDPKLPSYNSRLRSYEKISKALYSH